jgi:hypothetical protein
MHTAPSAQQHPLRNSIARPLLPARRIGTPRSIVIGRAQCKVTKLEDAVRQMACLPAMSRTVMLRCKEYRERRSARSPGIRIETGPDKKGPADGRRPTQTICELS